MEERLTRMVKSEDDWVWTAGGCYRCVKWVLVHQELVIVR